MQNGDVAFLDARVLLLSYMLCWIHQHVSRITFYVPVDLRQLRSNAVIDSRQILRWTTMKSVSVFSSSSRPGCSNHPMVCMINIYLIVKFEKVG